MQMCILQTRIHIFCLIPRLSKQKNTFNCNVLSSNNLGDQMATTKVSKSFFNITLLSSYFALQLSSPISFRCVQTPVSLQIQVFFQLSSHSLAAQQHILHSSIVCGQTLFSQSVRILKVFPVCMKLVFHRGYNTCIVVTTIICAMKGNGTAFSSFLETPLTVAYRFQHKSGYDFAIKPFIHAHMLQLKCDLRGPFSV